jgi:hypothetical protein
MKTHENKNSAAKIWQCALALIAKLLKI